MTYEIAAPCAGVLAQAWMGECPVDCVYKGSRCLYIHLDDCGAYGSKSLAFALLFNGDLPEQRTTFTGAGMEFVGAFGSPRRTFSTPTQSASAPMVAAVLMAARSNR